MIVVDSSVAVEFLLQSDIAHSDAPAIANESCHAPSLIDIEVLSAFRRLVQTGRVSNTRASFALGTLSVWPVVRHDYQSLLPRVWQLRHSVAPYDAVFVALAEFLSAPLWTYDGRLARSNGHSAEIVLLS